MNDNARKWVEALRSGEYQQATEALRSGDNTRGYRYCCLGVACDLYRQEVGGEWVGDDFKDTDGQLMEDAELPAVVRDWLGLRWCSGHFIPQDTGSSTLIRINDGGSTFAEIADVIESEPKGLFE